MAMPELESPHDRGLSGQNESFHINLSELPVSTYHGARSIGEGYVACQIVHHKPETLLRRRQNCST